MRSRYPSFLLVFYISLCIFATRALGQACPSPSMFPSAPGAFTHTAVADSGWQLPSTWDNGMVPGDNAIVCIPAGRNVAVTRQETSRLRFVQVNGILRMVTGNDTRLLVDTLYIASGGSFKVGSVNSPLQADKTAEIVFISWDGGSIDRVWDPEEKSRGLISDGSVKVFGAPKTHMTSMTANALNGSTHLVLDAIPSNWSVGDKIVITGTFFQQVTTSTSSQDEKVTITAISGSSIDFTPVLVYDHVRPRSDLRLHVANLTRNLVFRSESNNATLRGHMMLMDSDVEIRNARIYRLGRTKKAVPLDDMVVQCLAPGGLQDCTQDGSETDYSITPRASSSVSNRRGRYAVHFHLNGTSPGSAPPSKVYGSVVEDALGWAFVNHSSHVDFQNNVAYDFVGAGFVAEMGDELGNFDNNIAVRGRGNGEYRGVQLVFLNTERPQPLSDFAFSGDGFWFQGPAIRARNNVASGCDGSGMAWFTTGAPDVTNRFTENGGTTYHDRYSSFPRTAVSTVYAGFPGLSSILPRFWDHSIGNEKLVISDLPILECDGFESYGNFVGFRLRFNNFTNVSWYGESPYNFDNHIVPVIGSSKGDAVRLRQEVKNLVLWNNENGAIPNYTSLTDWSNVTLLNRLSYDGQHAYTGVELYRVIDDTTFTDLTIDGYEVAGRIKGNGFDNTGEITFLGAKAYSNYVNADTLTAGQSSVCPAVTGIGVTNVGATSRKVSWTANASHNRYMVRYQAAGEQQWKLVTTTGTFVTLTGLLTGKTYHYQVIAGCDERTTLYSAEASFPT